MANKKNQTRPPGVKAYKPGKERPPAIDKLLKPVAAAVAAMGAYHIFRGINTGIPRIDHDDAAALRKILYGTGPSGSAFAGSRGGGEGKGGMVVLCHPDGTARPVSSVFSDASADSNVFGPSVAEFALLDCELALTPPREEGDSIDPNAPSIADAFKIDTGVRPTIFVSGASVDGYVKQVPAKHLRTGSMLVKAVRSLLERSAVRVENSKELKAKCLDQKYCGLLLKGTSKAVEPYVKDMVRNLSNDFPQVQFASIDAASTMLSIEEAIPEFMAGQHRFIMFKKVSGTAAVIKKAEGEGAEGEEADKEVEDSGRLITSIRSYRGGNPLSHAYLSEFVSGTTSGTLELKKIPALPTVKTRTRKNEEAVQAKRRRAAERKAKEEEQRDGGVREGAFGTGADNKADRKQKRDELRAEHYKKNDVRERTPEELAEMERARRRRMEEEADKWNIGVEEDAPEVGDEDFVDEDLDEDTLLDSEDAVDLDEDWGSDGDDDIDLDEM